MPGLRLECSEKGDQERLLAVADILHEFLAPATSSALMPKMGPAGVSLKIIYAPGANVARVEVVAEVSEGKTPVQDMNLWIRKLKEAWEAMRDNTRLDAVNDILMGSVGFWPRVLPKGVYDELPAIRTTL